MDLNLKDKVVLISGSGRGIGKAIARAFLKEGARVMITDIDPQIIEKALSQLKADSSDRVIAFTGDLTRKDDIAECVQVTLKQWAAIDIFVGNLGSGKSKPVLQADVFDWQKMLDINLLGTVEMVRQIVPQMQKAKSGSIVFIASIAGVEFIGAPAGYAAAKAALLSYTKSLVAAVARDNIRVNAVAPGNIKFSGGRWEEMVKENPNVVKDVIEKEVPMRRFGTPEEIADVVVFLASDRSSFITGGCLTVDGGQSRSI